MFIRKSLIAISVGSALSTNAINAEELQQDKEARSIEVIEVRAQKRAQNVQHVGISVTAFSGDDLRSMGITQSNEVAAQVPNVTIANNGGSDGLPLFFIRGVGLTDFSNANSGPIAIYSNDVYLKAPRSQNFALFDIENVEILKGPQGTLFGRNTSGGAILFSSVKPTEDFEGNINVNAGSFGTYAVEGGIGGEIADDLLVRVAGRYSKSEGYQENAFTGESQAQPEKWALRSTFLYQATDNLKVTAIIEAGSKDGSNVPSKFRGLINPNTGGTCTPEETLTYTCANALGYVAQSDDLLKINNNLVLDHTEEYNSGTLRLDWDISDNISFASISNHLSLEAFQADDTDGGPTQILELFLEEESNQFTQEFQLLGQYDDSSWVLGGYYLKDSAKADHDYELLQMFAPIFSQIPTGTPIEDAQAALGPIFGLTGTTGIFNEIYDQEVESMSIFGQYELRFTDKWNLTLGARYTDEKTTMKLDTIFHATLLPIDVTGDGVEDIMWSGSSHVVALDDEISDSNLSGKIGLDYFLDDNIMFYGSISTAFKAPGFNTSAVFSENEAKSFDSEEMTAVEFGVKSDLLDNQLRINASIFNYDYDNMQVYTSRTTESGVPARFIDNAAKGVYQGAELEVIAMLTENLRVQMGLSYIDAELQDFFSEKGVDPETGEQIIEDLSGATTAFTPETSANIMLNHYWELASGELDLQVDYSWQDEVYHNTDNTEYKKTPSYGLLNSRLMWTNGEGNLSVSIWAKNIADERYISYTSGLEAFGILNDSIGMPRTVGASVSYSFD